MWLWSQFPHFCHTNFLIMVNNFHNSEKFPWAVLAHFLCLLLLSLVQLEFLLKFHILLTNVLSQFNLCWCWRCVIWRLILLVNVKSTAAVALIVIEIFLSTVSHSTPKSLLEPSGWSWKSSQSEDDPEIAEESESERK